MNKITIKFESEDREVFKSTTPIDLNNNSKKETTTFIKESEELCYLEKVLECFEHALKGAGFSFEGHLDIVEEGNE